MRIKMKSTMAGPDGNASPGQVIDVPDTEARALLAGGYAEAVDPPQESQTVAAQETATTPPPERAGRRRRK